MNNIICWSFITSFFADIRLAGDSVKPSEGRVEILYTPSGSDKPIWGTICDDQWEIEDAKVVCRQLGLEGAIAATREATFGRGTGRIWMNDVKCQGDEDSLNKCKYDDRQPVNCNHGEDAGVVCGHPKGEGLLYNLLLLFIIIFIEYSESYKFIYYLYQSLLLLRQML